MTKIALALSVVLLLFGFASAADLTGDVFVVMASGDVKRAADVAVFLVAATPATQAEFKKMVDRYKEQQAQLLQHEARISQEFSEARSVDAAARKERDTAFSAFHAVVDRRVDESDPEYVKARERKDAAFSAVEESERRMRAIGERARGERPVVDPTAFRRDFIEFVERNKTHELYTDVNGRYEGRGIREGSYYLFAQHKIMTNSICWYVPAEIKRSAQKIDLTGRNAGCPFVSFPVK